MNRLVYQQPLCEALDLSCESVLCASQLNFGGDGTPGSDFGFDDDFDF